MNDFFYRVKKGESIDSVSDKFFIPEYYIIGKNNLKCDLYEGQIILLKKGGSVYVVKMGETLDKILEKFNLSKENFYNLNYTFTIFPDQKIYID